MRNILILMFCVLGISANGQSKDMNLSQLKKENPDFLASILYSDGVQDKLAGNMVGAAELFHNVLKLNPNHSAAHYQLGLLAMQNGDFETVSSRAARAYQTDPSNADYQALYIEALIRIEKFSEAQRLLEDLRKKGPLSQKNYYYSTALAAQLGDVDKVEDLAIEYLNRWGYNSQIVDMYSSALFSKRQYKQVEDMLTDYIKDYPEDPVLRISLAKLKAAQAHDEEAIELFRSAIQIDSNDFNAHMAYADYYRIKNDITNYVFALQPVFSSKFLDPRAKAAYFEQMFFDPSILRENYFGIQMLAKSMFECDSINPIIENLYIRFQLFCGEIEQVKPILHAQLQSHRANDDTYRNLIQIYGYEQKNDSVLYYARIGRAKYPKEPYYPLMEAVAFSTDDREALAIESLQKALRIAGTDSMRSVILTFQGDLLYKTGKRKTAFNCYNKALKYDGNNATLLNNYAYFLSVENKRLDDALRMSKKANEIEDGNPTFLDTQAWVLYQMGRYEEARVVQRRALALEKEPSDVLLMHNGDILFKLGNNFLAENYWQKALDAGADKTEIENRLKQLK